jgi:two-component system, cell cycle sensor histidine kinase and response regulator CckA
VSPVPDSTENIRTILVVDDEPDVLRLIESILSDGGYRVVPARDANKAIQAFEKMPERPDLVLTDVVMPGMSGPMLVDHLLELQPNLRVLFMSGYDDRQVVQRYVVERGFRLITKPFTVKSLRSEVEAMMESRGATESKN